MPVYYYKAINQDGEDVEGTIQAFSIQMARAKLTQQKLKVDSLVLESESSPEEQQNEEFSNSLSPMKEMEFKPEQNETRQETGTSINYMTMLEISDRIADLTHARFPLTTGLLAVAENHPDRKFRKAAHSIVNELEKGNSLEQVLSQHGFSEDYLAIIKAGIHSKTIENSIQQYTQLQNQSLQLVNKFLGRFYYPTTILSASLLIYFVFFYWMAPQFNAIYQDFGSDLPSLSLLVVNTSDFIVSNPIPVLIFLFMFIGGMFFILKRSCMPGAVNEFMQKIPFWGRIFKAPALCRFYYSLSSFVAHHVSLPDSFRLAGEASRDERLSVKAGLIAKQIEKGTPASTVISNSKDFSPLFQQVFQWEEHPQFISDSLKALGEMEEIQMEGRIGFITPFIEPIILTVIAGTTLLIVIALFAPLIQLMNDLA